MTHLAPATAMHAVPRAPQRPGLIDRLRRHFAATETALAGQARRSAITGDMLSDTRLAPEDLAGAPSHDPALPFFLQSGFGRKDR
ncbi:hypothetical protein MCELHM10_03200 [Paracoccaceae bacterium]